MRLSPPSFYQHLLNTTRLVALAACLHIINPATAIAKTTGQDQPISFQADEVNYDQTKDIFTATGHVEIYQDNQIVLADRVSYDRANDKVTAQGKVTLVDKDGQAYFAHNLELQSALKQGFAEDIGLVFQDGSRFAARRIEQPTSDKAVLRNAVYSACNLCEDKPEQSPLWQIRASKVVNDKETKDIYYHNARVEAYGVPVVYIPYFSHPQPDVRARSGILPPTIGYESKTGFIGRGYYYHQFNDQHDGTLEVTTTQYNNEILGGEWRSVFSRGMLDLNGSINYSPVRGGSSENNIIKEEDWRGHLRGEGQYILTDTWRTGFHVDRTTDRFYLRDFDYQHRDILENDIYAERLDNRNYSRVSAHYFQDLRPGMAENQPDILPWMEDMRYGDPNDLLGGRWALNSQFITLLRDADPSVSRLSVVPSWQRQDIIDPIGLKTSIEGKVRNDVYWIREDSPYDFNPGNNGVDTIQTRIFPSMTARASYPMVKPIGRVTALIEPKTAFTLSPNISQNNSIPNEDSRDVQIDISNLFSDSRFPGVDRVESGTHVSYGVKVGGYTDDGNSAFVTLGQSHRFTENSVFPEGSGLNDNNSDYVGQVEMTFQDKLYLDYRFQLNDSNFRNQRQEAQFAILDEDYEIGASYLSAPAIAGTGLNNTREQIGVNASKSITKNWAAGVDTIHDLSGDAGLLNAGLTLQYRNECLRAAIRAERDLTDRTLGGSEDRIMFSLGLRNLGGYEKPLIREDRFFSAFGVKPRL
jgi:LPS-assembly protein